MLETVNVKDNLKEMMIARLYLDVTPEEINDDAPLSDEIGLDSVGVLELIVGIEELFNISFEEDPDLKIEDVFQSVNTLVDYIQKRL